MNPKEYALSQGISQNIKSRFWTMLANRTTNIIKSRIPIYGNDQALKNHIANALKNSGGKIELAIKNMGEIPPTMPPKSKAMLDDLLGELNKAKDDIIKTADTSADDMAKMGDEVSYSEFPNNSNLADDIAKNSNEVTTPIDDFIAKNKAGEGIKGDNFTMKEGQLTYLDKAKFELSDKLKNITGIDDKIYTSLAWLKSRYPEMFANKRAVKELIDYVLDEPNIIKAGNSENSVYLGKPNNNKPDDIVISKDNNKIIHANERKIKASDKAELESVGLSSRDALPLHFDTMPNGALKLGQKAHLDNPIGEIIPKSTEQVKAELKQAVENGDKELIQTKKDELIKAVKNDRLAEQGTKAVQSQTKQKQKEALKEKSKEFLIKVYRDDITSDNELIKQGFNIEVINNVRAKLENANKIKPIKEFGTNYAEFYRGGTNAVQKLLAEKQGQVAGAFYKEGLGDITIAWGVEGAAKSDGWGLAKIAKYHPEALDKIDEMLNMPIVAESPNRIKLSDGKYFISIRKDFNGEKQNWVLTAFEKSEDVSGRRTNLSATQSASEKTTSQNIRANSTANKSQSQGISQANRKGFVSPEAYIRTKSRAIIGGGAVAGLGINESQKARAERISELKSQIAKAVKSGDKAKASELRRELGEVIKG